MRIVVALLLLATIAAGASAKEACLRNKSGATVFFTEVHKNQHGGTSIGGGEQIHPGQKKCIKLPESGLEKVQVGPAATVKGMPTYLLEDCPAPLPDAKTTNYRAIGDTVETFACERLED